MFTRATLMIRVASLASSALLASTLTAQPPAAPPVRGASAMEQATNTAASTASGAVAGLRFRSIGPALTSGRISSFAMHPQNRAHYYVGVASGGVWKTVNAGTSWTPVFDKEASYSIGTVVLDPKNPSVVWVGTGENNSQRSVSYGDGVYRSEDGGRTWKNMGLRRSEHIARILIDPRSSSTVYVAAQGPLWGPGGDRGLFKTTDGGKTWSNVLQISEHTGVTDVVMDPRDPDVLIAASYQRRRHNWTLINGGPESAIHRSTDGGKTWTKVTSGLPTDELGRIGLAMSPMNPDVVYATVEAANRRGGIFRSRDGGVTWEKRNDFDGTAMYYATVVADPADAERIYVMSVFLQVSDDGGRTLRNLGERFKHVDNHMIWIDPKQPDYYLVGGDGGVYESLDRAQTWAFKANLPVTQFYDIAVDNAAPFYNVYGGTQDNFSLGGPSRTRSSHGILNQDWFVTQGGDGFVSRPDPEDPNIIYAESQHAGLVRYDRRTGERIGIQPQPAKGDPPMRWNWDAPLIISPHSHTRLYIASQRLHRSDDRGNSWRAVSGDLTRQVDRNRLAVMGRVWGPDAVAKNASTAFYSNVSAIAESPKKEGVLYVGTDDGLIQVSENGGGEWRKVENFPGVPPRTYVSRVIASLHNANTVYASFDNHQNADFAPYLLRSTDAGRSWVSIAGDLPKNGAVYAIAEDHVDPKLLFAGTEFGVFYTKDGGSKWVKLTGGLPTIAVRDIAIQRRENDLVLGTFGRGIYILDDYTPLRTMSSEVLAKEAELFPVRDAVAFIETQQYGLRGKAFQGEALYAADNPPFGAVFTYHLRDGLKSLKERRQDAEKDATKKGIALEYPNADQLRAEAEEEAPAILLSVVDASGKTVRVVTGAVTKGFQRVPWDLRAPAPVLPRPPAPGDDDNLFATPPSGHLVLPGRYQVTLSKRVGGVVTQLAGPVSFNVVADPAGVVTPQERVALHEFQEKVTALSRSVSGALELANTTAARLAAIKRALDATPAAPRALHDMARSLEQRLTRLLVELRGDVALSSRNEPVPESINSRVNQLVSDQARSLSRHTATHEAVYALASEELAAALTQLRSLVQTDLVGLERAMETAGAPYTPGRVP